ncbi:MAG: CPBP family intramembrane glutamic endopeptidase [Dehalococcoidia bacterium]
MTSLLKKEIGAAGSTISGNLAELVVICSAILFLVLAEYHSVGDRWSSALVFYVCLPVFTALLLLRRNPLDFGLRLGDWRVWRLYVVATCFAALPILFAASRVDSLQSYYSLADFDLWEYFLQSLGYLTAWEFLFRGYMLFGLKNRFKEASILIQMVPFVLLHLGKPELETISTIPMGLYLGYVAYRGNSCWPAVTIHIFINVSFRILVNWL